MTSTPFEKFDATCLASSLPAALDELADYLIDQDRYHELFEIRKLQLRERLGLPLEQWQSIDELPAEQGQALESGLLDVCREVGMLLFKSGDIARGWQYLEPVGDKQTARQLLRETAVTDENVEALIQVSLGHGLDAELGFQLVLDRFGTCSSITTYESQLAGQSLETRRGPARMLVTHLYEELCLRVREAISQQEGQSPGNSSLAEMMDGRDWLFEGLGHHIDTTHLASTIRISKILNDGPTIKKAIEMATYGTRLHEDFQYPGQVPFADTYRDTRAFLSVLKSDDPEKGNDPGPVIERLKAVATGDSESRNLDAAVWYVYLLNHLNRGAEATRAYLDLIHVQQAESMITEDVCPNLLTLIGKFGEFEIAREALLKMGDLPGYATVASIEFSRQ